MTDGLNTVAYA